MSTSIPAWNRIADRELLVEFRDALNDQVATLERQVANLRRSPDDRDSVATLFRALHTIKGDASICRFELGVRITHPIESLLVRLREGKLAFLGAAGRSHPACTRPSGTGGRSPARRAPDGSRFAWPAADRGTGSPERRPATPGSTRPRST
jgi:HPt (histidine-containing phosphotransfer) domain-containing protein